MGLCAMTGQHIRRAPLGAFAPLARYLCRLILECEVDHAMFRTDVVPDDLSRPAYPADCAVVLDPAAA